MPLSENLRKQLDIKGISARELAQLTKQSEKTIYKLTSGEAKNPTLSTIKPLIVQLGCTADELIFDETEIEIGQELMVLFKAVSELPSEKKDIAKQLLVAWVTSCKHDELKQ